MGMNTILILISGIVMSTMIASQVAPSIVEGVKVKKVQTQTINNQEVIFEAIKRYITIKQEAPGKIKDLTDAGYLDEKVVEDNGFSGKYEIEVFKELGVATITTTIVDPKAQEAFLNSFMGTSKPTRIDATKFETKYVLPNEIMHGNALLMTGIPIQATPPDSNINKYWYDTSSGKATLKIFDGTNWVEVNLGGEANTYTYKPGNFVIAYSGHNANIYIPYNGTITTTASLTAGRDFGEGSCRTSTTTGRVYINNVAVGSALSHTSGCPTTKSFNQNFNVNAGDIIKNNNGPIYIKVSNPNVPIPY